MQLEAIVSPKKDAKIQNFVEIDADERIPLRSRAKTENSSTKKLNEVSIMMERMLEVSNIDEKTKEIHQNLKNLGKELAEISAQIQSHELKNCNDKKSLKKIVKFLKKFLSKILNDGFDSRFRLLSLLYYFLILEKKDWNGSLMNLKNWVKLM